MKAASYLGASYSRRKGSLTVVWLLSVNVERRRPGTYAAKQKARVGAG